MAALLRTFTHKPGLLFYLDTTAVYAMTLVRAGSTSPKEQDRARDVTAFLAAAERNTSRGLCSVLVLEEIASIVRSQSQNPILVREGYNTWRDFRNADPVRSEAEGKAITARVLEMLTHAVEALASVKATIEQPIVSNSSEAGKKLRKAHRDFLRLYFDIDSMDALHLATGSLLGCKHFISFDKGWRDVTELEILHN